MLSLAQSSVLSPGSYIALWSCLLRPPPFSLQFSASFAFLVAQPPPLELTQRHSTEAGKRSERSGTRARIQRSHSNARSACG